MCYEDPRLIPEEDFAVADITQYVASNQAFDINDLRDVFTRRDGSLLAHTAKNIFDSYYYFKVDFGLHPAYFGSFIVLSRHENSDVFLTRSASGLNVAVKILGSSMFLCSQ